MKVKEIMQKEVKSLKPGDNAYEALALLFKMQISGLPVIDEQNKLVGMFTEKEIIAYILPSYIEKVGRFIYEEEPKAAIKKIEELSKIKVSQVMRKEVVTLSAEAALYEAAHTMLKQKARRVPVLDKSGKVIGIVTRGDVLKALFKTVTAQNKG